MSYFQFRQICNKCKKVWNASFGIVGDKIVAQPPEKCPFCNHNKIDKLGEGWDEKNEQW